VKRLLGCCGGPFVAGPQSRILGVATATGFKSADKTAAVSFTTSGLITAEFNLGSTAATKHNSRGIIVGKGGTAEAYGYFQSPIPTLTDGSGSAGIIDITP
jgi:hypothetical protein